MILIYLEKHTARSEYVFEFICKEQFGMDFKVTNDIFEFNDCTSYKINYSSQRLPSGFFINNNGLLRDDSLRNVEVNIGEIQGVKVLFPSADCDLGFDLFAATFYMLSRYEEYLPFTEDKYGRFKAKDCLAFKNGFLEMPVIDAGIDLLAERLKIEPKVSKFEAIMTYDVDVAFKFRGRSFGRNVGSAAKDISNLHFKNFLERLKTFLKLQKDPWDIYDGLLETVAKNELNAIFFFLLGEKSEHDRNLDYNGTTMEQLIRKVSEQTDIGIHPSFASNKLKTKMQAEKERLEYISGRKITKSRQHYLKLSFPRTYFNLIDAGISEDYTMGFPDKPGFRAGTCHPFYFYDLKNEEMTKLRIFPITCMEATFIFYDKIPVEKALVKILSLMKTVYQYGGTFLSIWHNESLEESGKRAPWKKVHDQMLRQVKAYLNK